MALTVPRGTTLFPPSIDPNRWVRLRQKGYSVVRVDAAMSEVFRGNVPDFSKLDALVRCATFTGCKVVFILAYAIGGGKTGPTGSAVATWAASAAQIVDRYKANSTVLAYEVWNEPAGSFWQPSPVAADYLALVLATCTAVRAVAPSALLWGGGSSIDLAFDEALFVGGAFASGKLDGYTVHPYEIGVEPEALRYRSVNPRATLRNSYAPTIPIYATEAGNDQDWPIPTLYGAPGESLVETDFTKPPWTVYRGTMTTGIADPFGGTGAVRVVSDGSDYSALLATGDAGLDYRTLGVWLRRVGSAGLAEVGPSDLGSSRLKGFEVGTEWRYCDGTFLTPADGRARVAVFRAYGTWEAFYPHVSEPKVSEAHYRAAQIDLQAEYRRRLRDALGVAGVAGVFEFSASDTPGERFGEETADGRSKLSRA